MTGAVNKLTSSENVEVAASILRAFAHPLRIKLLSYIHTNDKINVNKIYTALELEQSITSQHLRVLRDVGLVLTIREGKFVYYQLNYSKIEHIANSLQQFFANE